jgi:hypothetical protein
MTESEQKLAALAKANETRVRRAEFRRRAHAGDATVEELLAAPPPDWLRTQEVYPMLQALPRVGPMTARNAMRRAEVPNGATFGSLTPRARRALLDELTHTTRRRWL